MQGQVIGSGNTVNQYFVSPNAADPSHAASSLSSEHVWNIPFARNSFFTGREELLERLQTQFRTTQTAELGQPQAICGLGGIGKTQLALEYAHRHRQDYHAVLWGRADTREVLISTFVNIASLLDLPPWLSLAPLFYPRFTAFRTVTTQLAC